MKNKTLSSRIAADTLKSANKILGIYGSTKSKFLRSCIESFLENPETFLMKLGFQKKEVWMKKGEKKE